MILLLLAILFAWSAAAQVTTGSVSGYVLDPSGKPAPTANLTAIAREHGISRTARTDASGFYTLAELPAATYRITASAPGMREALSSVEVNVNARVRLDFPMQLATRQESVEVRADARRIATESSELGAVLDETAMRNLPLNRRDFLQLALLTPGVLPPVQESELSSRGGFAMHAGGGREEFNNYLLDGVDNNEPYENSYVLQPSVESIQEFKIATSTYSAEYGRAAAGQVNLVTRGGTGKWHGDLYEYLRNRALDARNFFDGAKKPKYARNQFGASAGGPLRKDRTFFFANFDGLRERRGVTRLATVPTAEQRASVPAARIAPVARRILDLFPLPNLPGVSGNYLAQPVLRETTSQFHGRLDHRIGASDQLTLRASYGNQDFLEPYVHDGSDLGGFGNVVNNAGHNAMLHYQHVFNPRTIHSLRIGFNRGFRQVLPENYRTDVGKLWGVDWLGVRPRDFGFPSITVAGFSLVGDATQLPIERHTNTYQILDGIALVRGNHAVKAGADVRRVEMNGSLDYFARGSLTFSGAITGSGISDLLLGFPSFALQAQFDNPQTLRTMAYDGYAQDDWKARPNLTLNLGLRYEYNTPATDPTNRMSIFDLQTRRIVNVGTGDVPRAGYRPDRNNLAPRVGFAWSPGTNLVVRGGYGIYYDSGMMVVNSSLYFNPPYFNVRAFSPTASGLLTLNDPFPRTGGITPPPSPNTLSPDLTSAYLQHWNLNVQRQLGSSTAVSVAYAGSKGTHLIRSRDLNQPLPGPGPVAARRPLPAFSGFFFIESGANSHFHSLEASLDRRLARNFALLASYTFSKSMDDASAFLLTRSDKNFPQDSHNYAAERAVSAFDLRHRFTAAYTYTLAGAHWYNRNVEFRGITVAQSGQAFTPYLRFDNSNTGNTGGIFGLDRPDALRDPHLDRRGPSQWFDTSAFRVPERYHFGSAGRNILRGPGLFTFDVALARRFVLREHLMLTFDAQCFNLLNRAQFDLPERYADEPATFGKIFSAKAPRQVQFALRLTW